jgi:Zn-dependent oligopeptidase
MRVGYYSYFWSEVLACDAFEYFKKNGLLNRKLGLSFRKNILEKGDSEDPMILYKRFRGRKPNLNAFLRLNGLI